MSTSVVETSLPPFAKRSKFSLGGWILAAAILLAAVCIFYAIVLTVYWPFKKQALIDALQEATLRTVTIQSFRSTYFPPGCIAENIAFARHQRKDQTPIIFIPKLQAEATYATLLTFQHRLSNVRISGMHITVPPARVNGNPDPLMPMNYKTQGRGLPIEIIFVDGAVLDCMLSDPADKPYRIKVDKVIVHGVGKNSSIPYQANVYVTYPPGIVRSEGVFGPWNLQNPGDSPLHGSYTYKDADLSALKKVSGTLNSSGEFSGSLKHFHITGTATIPNFKVSDSSHTRPVTASYRLGVDGVNGDVLLENVMARFERTVLALNGSVSGDANRPGKLVSLQLSSDHARIEDLVKLFISAPNSPMTGDIRLRGALTIPPGSPNLIQRMDLKGHFAVTSGKFTDRALEEDITRLSNSANGKKEPGKNSVTVLSGLTVNVSARDGIAHLSNVSFNVPGAHADLGGTFSLLNYTTNLYGLLTTQGNVSQASTGFKSFALKVMTPFFKRKQHAKVVGFKLSGRYGNTNMSLDLDAGKDMNKQSR
jgi:hypothetical protein